jgi:hypothetical protein
MRKPVIINETLGIQVKVLSKTEAEAERERMTMKHGHPFFTMRFTGTPWYGVGAARRREKLMGCTYKLIRLAE